MLQNISNFFNILKGKKVKKNLAPSDLIAIGVRNTINQSDYQPSAIFFKDLEAQLQSQLAPGPQGPIGPQGVPGPSIIMFTSAMISNFYLFYNFYCSIRSTIKLSWF